MLRYASHLSLSYRSSALSLFSLFIGAVTIAMGESMEMGNKEDKEKEQKERMAKKAEKLRDTLKVET